MHERLIEALEDEGSPQALRAADELRRTEALFRRLEKLAWDELTEEERWSSLAISLRAVLRQEREARK